MQTKTNFQKTAPFPARPNAAGPSVPICFKCNKPGYKAPECWPNKGAAQKGTMGGQKGGPSKGVGKGGKEGKL